MSTLYRDILNAFKEIGELHNNQNVIDKANEYLKQLDTKKNLKY